MHTKVHNRDGPQLLTSVGDEMGGSSVIYEVVAKPG
jgi:hypothetical protein